MKLSRAIILSAVAAAFIMSVAISLSAGTMSGLLSVLSSALLIAVVYVGVIGTAFHMVLKKMKKESYRAYAFAGALAGVSYLLVPMALSGEIGDLLKDFASFVPFGVLLIITGIIAGVVFRFCVFTFGKRNKEA